MIDGLTVSILPENLPQIIDYFKTATVYYRKEALMDCEKQTFYLSNGAVWTIVLYFDPRRDQTHLKPRRIIIHKVMTQFENFMFHQLVPAALREMETETLKEVLQFAPQTLYFDLMLGVWDTASWNRIFNFYPDTTVSTQDFHLARGRLKIAQYDWFGIDLKFYRLNPEQNKNHAAKYPWGWAGYTKAEFVSPRFGDYRKPLAKTDYEVIKSCFLCLQNIREILLGRVWEERNLQVATKTCARTDKLFVWSSTEQPLQGSMKLYEAEMTARKRISPQDYRATLDTLFKRLAIPVEDTEAKK